MKKDGREKKFQDTRNRAPEVSEDLFAEKGFDGTGIDEIARSVGIAKLVVCCYFENKKEILHTLL